MSIELTPEQSRVVAAEGDAAVVVDPLTRREYRFVSADVFQQWQASHPDASPWTADEMARLAGAAFRQLDDDDYGHYMMIGRFAGLAISTPTLDEFQAARREAWSGFPREFPDPTE